MTAPKPFFMTTERIGFSHWRAGDLEQARLLWGDADVTAYICASGTFSEDDIAARLALEADNQARYGVQYWPIFELASGELMGCCGLRPRGEPSGAGAADCYELGFHLRPKFWRRGYATEAAAAVVAWAFREEGAKKLFAGHHPRNAASAKVLAKLGFRRTGSEFYAPTGLDHPAYELLPPRS